MYRWQGLQLTRHWRPSSRAASVCSASVALSLHDGGQGIAKLQGVNVRQRQGT